MGKGALRTAIHARIMPVALRRRGLAALGFGAGARIVVTFELAPTLI
jgi:hypothetical protein